MYPCHMCVSIYIIALMGMRPLVAANLIANITEVLVPPLQIQETNKGTYLTEYYVTIHLRW